MESSSAVVSNTDIYKCVEDQTDKQSVKEKIKPTTQTCIDDGNNNFMETVKENKMEQSSKAQKEIDEVDDDELVEDGTNLKIVEKGTAAPDAGQTKTVKLTTVKKITPCSTETVVTTLSETKEKPAATTAVIKTTLSSYEMNNQSTEAVEKQAKEVVLDGKKEDNNKQDEGNENEEEYEEETENQKEEEKYEEAQLKQEGNKKLDDELEKIVESSQQLLNTEQIRLEPESQPTTTKEETVEDAPFIVLQTNQDENNIPSKQDSLNNAIKDIISSIDSNIKAEENIAALKERELELLKKQHELSKEIEQQQFLAQKLMDENHLKQQQLNINLINRECSIPPKTYQPITNVSKYTIFDEKVDNNVYSRKSETYETTESTNVTKKIDLHKIFTPATDSEEILPKNRKLYASSAFYSPTLHPTVEDQVALARRISHSLSDISNQQSRGQSMYVNRKKRSVKWVHEGCGQENTKITTQEEYDEEKKEYDERHHENVPLKFLMNPYGQMHDINSLRDAINTETGLLSPDVSAEVVTALQAQKGKGAELFAKRRKVSEKWVVDESNVGAQSPSGLPDYHQCQQQPKPSTSPSILPAYTDAAKHRVQLNLHQEQLLEKYARPGLKVVLTPWEAALNSGSASAAFVEEQKLSPYLPPTLTPSPTPQIFDASQGGMLHQSAPTALASYSTTYSTDDYQRYSTHTAPPQQQAQQERQQYTGTNTQRELAYKPSIPQGWKAPSMSLPKDLYMPREIPLQSYAPPPVATISSAVSPYSSNVVNETNQFSAYMPLNASFVTSYSLAESTPAMTKAYGGSNTFPVRKPYQQGFSSAYGSSQPPRQQYFAPQSYQKVPQVTSQNIPQVTFNPSPLPYHKLAKFENQSEDERCYITSPSRRATQLNVRGKVRNTSPVPFAGSYNRPYTPSSDSHDYSGTPSASLRRLSSTQEYSGYNTPTVTSNHILNAPSYNTSARGWGCSVGSSTGYQYPRCLILASKPQIVNGAIMPYTDF